MARRAWWVGLALLIGTTGCREAKSRNAPATFSVMPQQLSFTPTALGDAQLLEVTVSNQGTTPFKVYKLETTAPGLEFDPVEPFELSGGAARKFPVRFVPGVEGKLDGALVITTDSDTAGEQGVARVPFSGLGVKAIVRVDSSAIDFGNVELEAVEMRSLVLENPTRARTRFRIDVEGDDRDLFGSSEFSRVLELYAGETKEISVAFKPTRMGAAQAVAKVSVCPSCEPVPVTLSGAGVTSTLEVTPLRLDFGRVPVGAAAEDFVYVRNLGTEPLPYSGVTLLQNDAGVFSISRAPGVPGGELAPGSSVEIGVTFRPTVEGKVPNALLHVAIKAPNTGSTGPKIALVGEGGRGCVSVIPPILDFGVVPEGVSYTSRVTVLNRCKQQIWLSDFNLATTAGGFFSLASSNPSVTIPAAKSIELAVVFTPRAGSTTSEGSLTFKARDATSGSTELVKLVGSTRKFAPCSYRLVPESVDFGQVPVGAEVTLAVGLENLGTDDCFVSSMGLASGTDAAFTSKGPGNPRVAPGGRANLLVTFKPGADGIFGGLAEGFVNHASMGHPTVPLTGEGITSCFTVQPTTIEFGRMKLGCEPRKKPLVAKNQCTAPVTINDLRFDPEGSKDFTLSLPTVFEVPPGGQATFSSTYTPSDEGEDSSALRLATSLGGPFTVGLLGSAEEKPLQTDRYIQEAQAKVDLLFVIDNSGSMMEEQQNLAKNFAALLSAAQAQQIDYHIAVTTTGLTASPGGWTRCPGGAEGGENGRLFPVDNSSPRVITPQTANPSEVFARNVQVGWCHWNEQGLDAAYRALSDPLLNGYDDPRTPQANDGNAGFLRPDAKLAIVFVTDEEDFSTYGVSFYETYFRSLKNSDPALLTVSAIVGPEKLDDCPSASSTGTRYLALARATGGVIDSICTPNWADSLKNLSNNTFGARRSFPLSELPEDTTQVRVYVDGVELTTGWSYHPAPNAVIFDSGSAPSAGALIEITYPLGC